MLRLADEILLLVLDEGRGELAPGYPPDMLGVVFAGAVLMESSPSRAASTPTSSSSS